MSKAFTRETDGGDDDDDIALPPLPVGGKNYITPQGYARLRGELLTLIDDERPKVVETVHWAAKNGDRSENGDYLYGKKRLREIDRRIRFLTKRLEVAEVTDPSVHHGGEQVFFGARVSDATDALAPVDTLVVTHGGAMRAALHHLCGFDLRQLWAFDLPYGALLSLRIWRGAQPGAQIIGLRA